MRMVLRMENIEKWLVCGNDKMVGVWKWYEDGIEIENDMRMILRMENIEKWWVCGNDMSIILRMIWEREWYEDDIGYWMIMENIEKWWVCGNDMRRAGAHWLRNWLTRAHLNKHEGLGCLGAVRARCWGSHPLLKHGFRWNTKVAYLMWWTCANPFNRGHRLKQRWNTGPLISYACVDT